MSSMARWHTAGLWVLAALWLVGSGTAVTAQDGRWERLTAAGVQALAQGDYAEAARQFQAALPVADAGHLPTSLMHLAAVYDAQGQYADAASLYHRALVLQEQVLGPDHPRLLPVLEANAAVYQKLHPVQSLLPWSPASRMATRARRIQEREALALRQDGPWGTDDPRHLFDEGRAGE